MNIKKLTLPTALALCFAFWLGDEVRAQETTEKEPKWEVGVDMYGPFRKNNSIVYNTYGLILRKKLTNGKALRFRNDFYFNTSIDPPVKGSNQPSFYKLSFDLGYENQDKYGRFCTDPLIIGQNFQV
jgi:hypothetical protein